MEMTIVCLITAAFIFKKKKKEYATTLQDKHTLLIHLTDYAEMH